jgi:hypothetical protein
MQAEKESLGGSVGATQKASERKDRPQNKMKFAAYNYARIDSDKPKVCALIAIAPGVRFNAFEILATPAFCFAMVFMVRRSVLVHSRRTRFLFFFNF